ncbi:hypothetical protein COCNU_03G000820 [Cocos nucifera]|uniref:Uncharacterized protein n=1 Tax=Cocos nucifera TaxID=13894 RepID=A0A8K0I1G1_COCNU|nr:hypothetical protein COCNU_03G000820 [Cocos nucifera]
MAAPSDQTPLPLQGRVAIVTGGAGGIGSAVAPRLPRRPRRHRLRRRSDPGRKPCLCHQRHHRRNLRSPAGHRGRRRRLQCIPSQVLVRRRRACLRPRPSHPRHRRRRHRRRLPVDRRDQRRNVRLDVRHQLQGHIPLLPGGGEPAGARRRRADHHVLVVGGGVAAAGLPGLLRHQGCRGGDDEDSGEGAQGDGDHGQRGGPWVDRDADVLRGEVGGGCEEVHGGDTDAPAGAAGGRCSGGGVLGQRRRRVGERPGRPGQWRQCVSLMAADLGCVPSEP